MNNIITSCKNLNNGNLGNIAETIKSKRNSVKSRDGLSYSQLKNSKSLNTVRLNNFINKSTFSRNSYSLIPQTFPYLQNNSVNKY